LAADNVLPVCMIEPYRYVERERPATTGELEAPTPREKYTYMGRKDCWNTGSGKFGSLICLLLSILVAGLSPATAQTTAKSEQSHWVKHKKASARAAHATPSSSTASSHARVVSSRRHSATHVVVRRTSTALRGTGHATRAVLTGRRHRYYERFSGNSFLGDPTTGDITGGEDPIVRAAAIQALGNMNGTAVAIDPNTGR